MKSSISDRSFIHYDSSSPAGEKCATRLRARDIEPAGNICFLLRLVQATRCSRISDSDSPVSVSDFRSTKATKGVCLDSGFDRKGENSFEIKKRFVDRPNVIRIRTRSIFRPVIVSQTRPEIVSYRSSSRTTSGVNLDLDALKGIVQDSH